MVTDKPQWFSFIQVQWEVKELMSDPVLFTDFDNNNNLTSSSSPPIDSRVYKLVTDSAKLKKMLAELYIQSDIGHSQVGTKYHGVETIFFRLSSFSNLCLNVCFRTLKIVLV